MSKKKSRSKKARRAVQKQAERVRKQVGLLVTKELQAAIDACKEEVARIAKECRELNIKYRDPDFDLQEDWKRCIYGLNYRGPAVTSMVHIETVGEEIQLKDIYVQRITEIFDTPKFYDERGAADASDIVQGKIGDCYFLAALGTVCCIPKLIEKICVARDEEVGVYGFIFFQDDGWTSVIIDDLMITQVPQSFDSLDQEEKELFAQDRHLYRNVQKLGGKHLLYAKSGADGETWVPLIEKAYAKLYGNYQHLDHGWGTEAIEDLTGGVSTTFVSQDILDKDRFWKEEILKANTDRLLSAAFSHPDTQQGLFSRHEYSILRAAEWNGKRFIVVRNPWGSAEPPSTSEWTGPWSDGSKEWTPKWIGALSVLKHQFGEDGQFVMEYSDFLQCFQRIGRTFLFDDSWIMVSEWMKVSIANIPEVSSYGTLSYRLTVPEATKAMISLSSMNTRGFSSLPLGPPISFEFSIVKLGEKQPLRSTPHCYYSRATLEVDLEAGTYTIYVKIEHHSLYTMNANVSTRTVSSTLASKVKSLSLVKNWDSQLKHKCVPKSLEDVIEEDLREDATTAEHRSEVGSIASPAPKEPEKALNDVLIGPGSVNGGNSDSHSQAPETLNTVAPPEGSKVSYKSESVQTDNAPEPLAPKHLRKEDLIISATSRAVYVVVLIFIRDFILRVVSWIGKIQSIIDGTYQAQKNEEDNLTVKKPTLELDISAFKSGEEKILSPLSSPIPGSPLISPPSQPRSRAASRSSSRPPSPAHSRPPSSPRSRPPSPPRSPYIPLAPPSPAPLPLNSPPFPIASGWGGPAPESWDSLYSESQNSVYVGLRVYTKTKEPCSIVGRVKSSA